MKAQFSVPLIAAALAGSALAQTSVPPVRARTGMSAPATSAARADSAAAHAVKPCTTVTVDEPLQLTLGKSRLIRLDFAAARLVVGGQASSQAGRPPSIQPVPGNPNVPGAPVAPIGQQTDGVAETQITLLSPTELYFLGRRPGSMNVVLQSADGRCLVKDIVVTVDPQTLQAKLNELMPAEPGVKVRAADNALVLTGTVRDPLELENVMRVAGAYVDSKHLVNLLSITAPQQVMLEVKIAEVSKTLLDRFGLDFSRLVTSANGATSSIISGIIGGGAATLGQFHPNVSGGAINGAAAGSVGIGSGAASANMTTVGRGATMLGLDAQKRDGIVRVLAEPNIMAISGQAASFLSGGKIFIPVAQNNSISGGTTITLQEKEFGVGLKFTPTVLDGNRINLKLVSEASDLVQTGSPFTTFNGVTSVLPSMVTRRMDTTVQLGDGQSFVVAGLIKNNANEALTKFPGLGEVPIMGALFRSTEFQTDQTELMFVVTPRLVKPLTTAVNLPTDNHVLPNSSDIILMGRGEGSAPARAAAAAVDSTPAAPQDPASAAVGGPVTPAISRPERAAATAPGAAPAPAAAPVTTPVTAPLPAPPQDVQRVAAPQPAPTSAVDPEPDPPPAASSEPVRQPELEPTPIAAVVEAAPITSLPTTPAVGY